MPFKNLSGDQSQAYFADGLSEELRATLARNLKLQVMAQASSAVFRDRNEDAVTIASTLGVAYLLVGSVQRSEGHRPHHDGSASTAPPGSAAGQEFDRVMQGIFRHQDEIATKVAEALVAEVDGSGEVASGNGQPASPSGGTTSVAAYDAYLRGRALYDLSADETSERAALAQFDAAIAADPDYAAAHAARARSLTAIANQYGEVGQLAEYYDAAITSARRAIAIAPDLCGCPFDTGVHALPGATLTLAPRANPLSDRANSAPARRPSWLAMRSSVRASRPRARGRGSDQARADARSAESADSPGGRIDRIRRTPLRRLDTACQEGAFPEPKALARECGDRGCAPDARARRGSSAPPMRRNRSRTFA